MAALSVANRHWDRQTGGHLAPSRCRPSGGATNGLTPPVHATGRTACETAR